VRILLVLFVMFTLTACPSHGSPKLTDCNGVTRPVTSDSVMYNSELDRDKDGIICEP
jgi:Excalibur calcium-binding domain